MKPKLTHLQWELLDRICRSNGGGVSVGMSDNDEFRRAQSLYRRGLAQGKNGEPYRAVHTPEGLRVWREMIASAE
jgi:hypothetical protein